MGILDTQTVRVIVPAIDIYATIFAKVSMGDQTPEFIKGKATTITTRIRLSIYILIDMYSSIYM